MTMIVHHSREWDIVAEVSSTSEPDKQYLIKRRQSDGLLGCTCLAYRFKKGEKTCKHLIAYGGARPSSAQSRHHKQQHVVAATETFSVRRLMVLE